MISVAVLVVAGGTAADFAAKAYAQGKIEDTVAARTAGTVGVSASINSFPFVGRLLAGGKAGTVTVHLARLGGNEVELSDLSLRLADLRLDRNELLSHRRVVVRSISRGELSVAITAAELSRITHVPVTVAAGRIEATVAGRAVAVTPTVTASGSLRLSMAPLPAVAIPIAQSGVVPCAVGHITTEAGAVRLSCTFTHVPDALARVSVRG